MRKAYFLLIGIFSLAVAAAIVLTIGRKSPATKLSGTESQSTPGVEFADGWMLRWGASPKELSEHFGSAAQCRGISTSMRLTHCDLGHDSLIRPFKDASMWFEGDRFFRGYFVFAPRDYSLVEGALAARFRQQGARTDSLVRNYTGGRVEQIETGWALDDVNAELKLHDGMGDQGSLTLTYLPIANGDSTNRVQETNY
jgi:hypothetical protein